MNLLYVKVPYLLYIKVLCLLCLTMHCRFQVYMVAMNSMYIVPLVIVFLICLGGVLVMFPTSSRSRVIAILSYPIGTAAQKRLIFVFFIFAVVWCVWTAPIWMHTWVSPTERLAAESQ